MIKVTIEAETADEIRAIAAHIAAGLPVGDLSASTDLPKLGQRIRLFWRKTSQNGSVTQGSFVGTVTRLEHRDASGYLYPFIFRDIEDSRSVSGLPSRTTSYRSLSADEIVSWSVAA